MVHDESRRPIAVCQFKTCPKLSIVLHSYMNVCGNIILEQGVLLHIFHHLFMLFAGCRNLSKLSPLSATYCRSGVLDMYASLVNKYDTKNLFHIGTMIRSLSSLPAGWLVVSCVVFQVGILTGKYLHWNFLFSVWRCQLVAALGVVPASRVAMDTSSLLVASGHPLTLQAPAPKLITSDEFK